jgi:hypothetical protein
MHDAYEAFRDCGWAAWLCLLIALPAVTAALIGLVLLVTKARGGAWVASSLAVTLGLCALATGFFGRQNDIAKFMGATSSVNLDPALRDRIRAEGLKEANQCIKIGGVTGGLPLALGAIAIAIGLATRSATSKAKEGAN